jgi:hypothetical protein
MSGSARMNEFTGTALNATPKTSKMALLVFHISFFIKNLTEKKKKEKIP